MYDYFNAHPKSVKMTYAEHAIFSLHISWCMTLGSIGAIIHAINPNWCQTSSTKTIQYLASLLETRHT